MDPTVAGLLIVASLGVIFGADISHGTVSAAKATDHKIVQPVGHAVGKSFKSAGKFIAKKH